MSHYCAGKTSLNSITKSIFFDIRPSGMYLPFGGIEALKNLLENSVAKASLVQSLEPCRKGAPRLPLSATFTSTTLCKKIT